MKNILSSSFLILTLLLSSCASIQDTTHKNEAIVILHTNDVHAGIDEHIGYAGLVAYKKEMEKLYGEENVILVDAGDAFQGESIAMLTQGEAIVTLMNEVDYDYFTLGNHEFDYQIPRLFELTNELKAQVLSSNFIQIADNTAVYSGYEIYTVNDIDIAFIGVTTPESLTKASASTFQDDKGNFIYTFEEDASGEKLYKLVQKNVDNARADGAEYVVALTHLGIEPDSKPWRSTDLIAHVEGIDIVLDGHSHSLIEGEIYQDKAGNDVILSQAGSKLKYIGQVIIDPSKGENLDISATLINELDTLGKKDPAIEAKIDEIQAEFKEILMENIAYTHYDLISETDSEELSRKKETNLGNLIADAYKTLLETEVAIVNGGGIRANILKGDITFQNIIDVHPFGNYIISMEVSGKMIKDALELGAKSSPSSSGGFLQVSGITYEIDNSIPSSVKLDEHAGFLCVDGEYRVKNIKINGENLDENRMYSLASQNYLLKNGGDGMTMFKDSKIIRDMFMLDSDLLIKYITKYLDGNIGEKYANPEGEHRITILN